MPSCDLKGAHLLEAFRASSIGRCKIAIICTGCQVWQTTNLVISALSTAGCISAHYHIPFVSELLQTISG